MVNGFVLKIIIKVDDWWICYMWVHNFWCEKCMSIDYVLVQNYLFF